ncbi:MAG TPA: endolytic transglycosylase MltG, partial [Planctomycetota bacterium]|nr:endolytic transglycosylase MltG [Planctomycetota bacterium]
MRSRTRYLPRLLAAGVALAALLAAAGAYLAWRELGRPYSGWSGPYVDVELDAGLTASEMFERLGQAGVLRRPALLRRWTEIFGGAGSLHAGEYRFDEPISPLGVLERLESGVVLLHTVTVPEGLGNAEIASRFVEAGFGTAETLLAAFADPAPVRDLDPGADSLEGYLFPETYRFARGVEPSSIAGALVGRFRESVGPSYARRAESV